MNIKDTFSDNSKKMYEKLKAREFMESLYTDASKNVGFSLPNHQLTVFIVIKNSIDSND